MADSRTIRADVRHLVADRPTSFLTSASAAAATTLNVKNVSNFADNDFLLVGELGSETAEIVQVNDGSIDASITTDALALAHDAYDKVTKIAFNQVEFSTATTTTGTKTVLSTKAIEADRFQTTYDDTSVSSGYYFFRFKETEGSTFSSYSDPIPYAGESISSTGFAIDYALKRNKTKLTDDVTERFLIDEINACLRYITGKRKKWSQLQSFNNILGQTARGEWAFTMPTDIWDKKGGKSILDVRCGTSEGLERLDKKEWENQTEGVIKTEVTTAASSGDTTLEIDNSYDFADSGTVSVYISGTKYDITYTGVTRSATAGVLTGVPASSTGSISVTIPVDTNVWQGQEEGTPLYYTVMDTEFDTSDDADLYIYPLPNSSNDNMNIWMDYWTAPTEVDSRGDILDILRFDMVKYWLTWAVRSQLKNDGQRALEDSDYIMFERILNDAMVTERSMQKFKTAPLINGIYYNGIRRRCCDSCNS